MATHIPVIVVAVDGSEHSVAALRWAVRHAQAVGGTIRAATVAHFPVTLASPELGAWVPVESSDEIEKRAGAVLDQAIAEAAGDPPPVPIEPVVLLGGAVAHRLTELAEGADLLVVGSRGLGGFRGLLLGAVSQQVVTHATCPTVVIPLPHE